MADFNKAVSETIEREGGLTSDPSDSGGTTRYGISQRAYPDENILGLTVDRAKFLYKRDYWDKIMGDNLVDQGIAELLFDSCVNIGVKTAIILAQRVLGVDDDGIIGQKTIYALNTQNAIVFNNAFTLRKIEYYINIIKKKPGQLKYAVGWIDRTLKMVL